MKYMVSFKAFLRLGVDLMPSCVFRRHPCISVVGF